MEPKGKPWILDGLADAMPIIVEQFKINTAVQAAAFPGASSRTRATISRRRGNTRAARLTRGGRILGNTQKGDGERFRGRGLIQLTGRANYTAASTALSEPYVDEPDLVERFPAAAIVSGWFWQRTASTSTPTKTTFGP